MGEGRLAFRVSEDQIRLACVLAVVGNEDSTLTNELIDQVAQVCHEANRAYCQTIGDNSQPGWNQAPQWQRDSARKGVEFHFAHWAKLGTPGSPGASYLKWLEQKEAEGWKYGPVKNPETKEHPCFVPYDKLPLEQRRKDYIFAAICEAFCKSSEYEAVA